MNVKQLIEELSKHPSDMEVECWFDKIKMVKPYHQGDKFAKEVLCIYPEKSK